MQDHKKVYESEMAFLQRLKVFQDNHFLVQQLNKEQQNVGSDVAFQLNKFADMTQEEFRKNVLMAKRNPVSIVYKVVCTEFFLRIEFAVNMLFAIRYLAGRIMIASSVFNQKHPTTVYKFCEESFL